MTKTQIEIINLSKEIIELMHKELNTENEDSINIIKKEKANLQLMVIRLKTEETRK